MKFCRFSLTVIFASALLFACAPVNQLRPVTGQLAKTQQFSNQNGLPVVEFTPPQGANWYETERSKKGLLVYGKKLAKENDTFVAYVFVADRNRNFADKNEFLEFIKGERAKDKDSSRFNMLVNDQSMDSTKKSHCAKYHYKAEDRVLSKKSGESVFLEAKGYSCVHPTKPHLITIEYSERSTSPFKDPISIAEGEAFLNSLVMN